MPLWESVSQGRGQADHGLCLGFSCRVHLLQLFKNNQAHLKHPRILNSLDRTVYIENCQKYGNTSSKPVASLPAALATPSKLTEIYHFPFCGRSHNPWGCRKLDFPTESDAATSERRRECFRSSPVFYSQPSRWLFYLQPRIPTERFEAGIARFFPCFLYSAIMSLEG